MIICDVCETLIIVRDESLVICGNCGFDNTYQLEDEDCFDDVTDFMDEYDYMDDDVLNASLYERFGVSKDQIDDILREQDLVGKNLVIKRK